MSSIGKKSSARKNEVSIFCEEKLSVILTLKTTIRRHLRIFSLWQLLLCSTGSICLESFINFRLAIPWKLRKREAVSLNQVFWCPVNQINFELYKWDFILAWRHWWLEEYLLVSLDQFYCIDLYWKEEWCWSRPLV